jgi:hypothetical protein
MKKYLKIVNHVKKNIIYKIMSNETKQTAVEWLESIELERDLTLADWKKAKEMEKEQAQAYTAFCVACDRKKLYLLEFEGWIKLEGGEQ